MTVSLAERFYRLFQGYEHARGAFDVRAKNERGKVEGKALTFRDPVTVQHWQDHLDGKMGVGIVPLRADNTCYFGFIDIDGEKGKTYDVNVKKICDQFKDFPVVVFRSKSGGAHVGCFMQEPAPASLLHEKLSEWAAAMGYGGVEIFPKQTMRASENDVGNWINMPYFDIERTTRYAMDKDGNAMTAEQLFAHIDATKRMLTVEQLENIKLNIIEDGYFEDGPPCLQVLHGQGGFPDGTRNQGLFNVGVYLRSKFADDWQEKLAEYNIKHMDPPLKQAEVQTIAKSITRKSYSYRCKEDPICNFCDRKKCLKRKFGVGNGGASDDFTIMLGSLTKIDSTPPIWIVDLEGKRVEVDTDTLLSQRKFQQMCMERVHKVPPPVNANRWATRMNELLANVEVIPAPEDASEEGQFRVAVESFCDATRLSKDPEDLVRGRVVHDTKAGLMYFRAQDLIKYLENRRFRGDTRPNVIWSMLRKIGADKKQFQVKGKCVQTWSIPEVTLYEDDPLNIPPMPPVEQNATDA